MMLTFIYTCFRLLHECTAILKPRQKQISWECMLFDIEIRQEKNPSNATSDQPPSCVHVRHSFVYSFKIDEISQLESFCI